MSEGEGLENAYCIEYARSSRSTCQGCKNLIDKGDLRLGSPVLYQDSLSYKWRHWVCLSETVLKNMRGKIERISIGAALTGRDKLKPADKRRVERTLESGLSEEEKEEEREEGEEEGAEEYVPPPQVKTPKKRAIRKRKEAAEEVDEDYSPKSKKRRAPKKAAKAAKP